MPASDQCMTEEHWEHSADDVKQVRIVHRYVGNARSSKAYPTGSVALKSEAALRRLAHSL